MVIISTVTNRTKKKEKQETRFLCNSRCSFRYPNCLSQTNIGKRRNWISITKSNWRLMRRPALLSINIGWKECAGAFEGGRSSRSEGLCKLRELVGGENVRNRQQTSGIYNILFRTFEPHARTGWSRTGNSSKVPSELMLYIYTYIPEMERGARCCGRLA